MGRVATPRHFLRQPSSGSYLLSSASFLGSVSWKTEGEVPQRGNIQIARSAFVTMATPLGILLFSTSGNWRGSEKGWGDRSSRVKSKGSVRKPLRLTGSGQSPPRQSPPRGEPPTPRQSPHACEHPTMQGKADVQVSHQIEN